MNITELARKLKLSVEITRRVIPRVGFDIGFKAIKVEDGIAEQIVERVKKSPDLVAEIEQELKGPQAKKEQATPAPKQTVLHIPDTIAVRDFAQLLHQPVTQLVGNLMKNGIFANLNEELDFDTAAIIAEDLGFEPKKLEKKKQEIVKSQTIQDIVKEDKEKTSRPPVVVIMGHVDHGKTLLLDAIRLTNVVDQEAGGITQHIGAYQIKFNERLITFIDTPGHEAFTAMRSRGATVADLAIVVIAWDEGIKPQTVEAFNIVKKMELPFIVAITKTDKQGFTPDKVYQQLAEMNFLPESWGGHTTVVAISAKTKQNLDELLNLILLRADLDAEKIQADSKRPGVGTIIESHIDKGEGPVASVIIQTGTLHTGDLITAGQVAGKIKALKDDRGNIVKEAPPSMPVKILGLKELPLVGDILMVTSDKKALKKILKVQGIRAQQQQERQTSIRQQLGDKQSKKDRTYSIILRADNLGSEEAILESLEKLPQDEVKVNIIRQGLGTISESDVAESASTGAVIYAFHTSTPPTIKRMIETAKAQVREFDVIYKLIEDIIMELEMRLPQEVITTTFGAMKIVGVFQQKGKSQVVGGPVTKDKIRNNLKANIVRKGMQVGQGDIKELRIGSRVVDEVNQGTECGVKIDRAPHIQVGDEITCVSEERRKRKLIS